MLPRHYPKLVLALLVLAICSGTLQAAATLTGPAGVTLACDTTTGAVSSPVGIKLVAAGSTLVTPSFPGGSPLAAAPVAATVASTTVAVNFNFSVAAGCAGASNGQIINLTFTPAVGTALVIPATLSITGSVLVATPSAITLNCDMASGPVAGIIGIKLKSAGSYLVTPSFPGGSPLAAAPAGATVASTSVNTNFSFSVAAGCSGATNGQTVAITFTPATGNPLVVTATISLTSPTLTSSVGSAITLTCDTLLGPSPANIGITLASAGTTYAVTAASPSATVVLVNPSSGSVSSTTTPVVWGVHAAAGCKNVVNNSTVALTFTPTSPSGGQVLTVTATLVLTNSGSALAPSPAAVTISCTKTGSTYSSISSQTLNVTSPANYGTPFTVNTSVGHAPPTYLSVTPTSGGTASSSAVALAVTANSGCGNLPVGNTQTSFSLSAPPAADVVVPVTIQVGAAAPLTATAVALTYTKSSHTYNSAPSTLAGPASTFYLVDTTTLPLWLNATATSGSLSSGGAGTLTLIPTAGADTLALGTYTATVHLKVSGDLDSTVAVTLQVKSAASSIVVAESATQNITWTLGNPLPSLQLTPISTGDAPIPYTVTTAATAGGLVPQVNQMSGVAYSFGPALSVSFLQAPFSAAAPGAVLSGTVTITWTAGGGGSAVITINVTAVSPAATISSISPGSLPTATNGTFTVVLTGSGFVSAPSNLVTKVGIMSGGLVVPDSNVVATVQNATTIDLAITVPANADPFLPFSGVGGTVQLGVCNPGISSPCYTPSSTYNLTIGVNPIVQAVTSASSFMQATPPALTPVAPYDMLSVFGTNFCISNGTGCTTSSPANPILYGAKDPATLRYLTQVSPDAAGSQQRNLTVTFQTHGSSPMVIATAPILFATNNQINLLVPDAVKAYAGNTVDMVVGFGYGSGSTMLNSLPFSVTIAATNPGIFAMSGDGQGDAAVLSGTYALVNQANPAGAQLVSTNSDIVQLYVTGLGRPDSDGTGTGYSATCMPADSYWAAVNTGCYALHRADFR